MSTAKEWRQCIRDEQGADDAGRGGMSGIMTIYTVRFIIMIKSF